MNIEIANRLVKLRKDKNLSQEALANSLGISRQAVSKWERAESSPDTDNLILLAKLYDISLDELLNTNQERLESEKSQKTDEKDSKDNTKGYVHMSFKDGIHIKEPDGDEVHVGWDGIHVKEIDGEEVRISWKGTLKDWICWDWNWWSQGDTQNEWDSNDSQYNENHKKFPLSIIVLVTYIILGVKYHMWHPCWLIFGIIPIFHSLVSAIKQRNIMHFSYPVLVIMYVGYQGFVNREWYPHWLWFLSIPVFYSIVGYVYHKVKNRKK